ncbi:MAG: hypothetical protein ACXWUG_00190 [Polyangiales bacterium]
MSDAPIDSTELTKKRSPLPFVIGAVVVLGGIGAALVVADRKAEAKKKEAIDTAWSKLATCLVGPLDGGDKPSTRARQIQVTNAIDDPKVPASERWPIVCQPHSANLIRLLNSERMAKAGGGDLAAAAAEIDKLVVSPEARLGDISGPIDTLFAKAKEQGVSTIKTDVAPPVVTKALLSFEELKKAKPLSKRAIGPKAIAKEVHRGRGLTFLVTDESIDGRTRLCSVDENGAKAICKKLPAAVEAVGGESMLLSSRDAEIDPLISFGNASALGAYTGDTGVRVVDGEKFAWAWRRRDGHAITLSYRNEYDKKLRLAVDGKAPGTMLVPPGKVANENLYYAATLVPGFVLWRGFDEEGEPHLWSQPLAPDGNVGPAEIVGPVGGWYAQGTKPQIRSCQSDRGAVAVVLDGQFSAHVTIEKDGKWTIPAVVGLDAARQELACHAGTLTFTWTTEANVVQTSCAHGICDTKKAGLPTHKGTRRLVVDLDGTVAMLERPDPRGGYHLAIANIDQLETTKTTPLFDDFSNDPKLAWLQDVSFETLGSAALAILKTTEGTYFVRIGKDGKVTPIDVQL